MARDEVLSELRIPFERTMEVLVSLSNAEADLVGWFAGASVVGITLEQVRTYRGNALGQLVLIPWTSIVYVKRYEPKRAE